MSRRLPPLRIGVFDPVPAIGHMPFSDHRTQEQVRLDEEAAEAQRTKFHHKLGREMSMAERRKDANKGSAMLRKAIRGAAARIGRGL